MNARNPYLWFSIIGLIILVIAALVVIPNFSRGAQATSTPTPSHTSVPAITTAVIPTSQTSTPQNTATARPSATTTLTQARTATATTTFTPTKRVTQAAVPTQTVQPQATSQPSATAIVPTVQPTAQPTEQPTEAPTSPPLPTSTAAPTATPPPTTAPTEQPTEVPTQAPTEAPTESPTTLAAGFVSSSSSGGTGLEVEESEFLSAQSSNRAEARESEIDWMEQLWRWTGPVVVALLISVGVLLWLAELAPVRWWRLASIITRITAKPAQQSSLDKSR